MQYLCPKCGDFMQSICVTTIPSKSYYACLTCGYSSKIVEDTVLYTELPKELQSEEDDEI